MHQLEAFVREASIALANPGRVRAMALYEPTLFALLDAETPPPN